MKKSSRKKPTLETKFDWQKVRQRLARAIQATAEAEHISPERARQVLEERARALAQVPAQQTVAANVFEVVTFTLARERYALATPHVREIVRLVDYTPIPGAPDFLVGIINLRGEILAVFDLRRFFALGERGLSDLSRVIVLGGERSEFGVLADAVHEVTTLRRDEVHEAPPTLSGVGRQYLQGVTQDALVVLDGAGLLQDARLFLDQEEEMGPA